MRDAPGYRKDGLRSKSFRPKRAPQTYNSAKRAAEEELRFLFRTLKDEEGRAWSGWMSEGERVHFFFTWCEADRKRDPDGVHWGAKWVLDAMRAEGLILADGARHVGTITHDMAYPGDRVKHRWGDKPWPGPGFYLEFGAYKQRGGFIPCRLPDANEMGRMRELAGRIAQRKRGEL